MRQPVSPRVQGVTGQRPFWAWGSRASQLRRVPLAALALFGLCWLCFHSHVGLRTAVEFGVAGQTGMAVAWLRAIECVSRGTLIGWKAHVSEVNLREGGVAISGGSLSLAFEAAERYSRAAELAATPPWRADAAWRKARLIARSGAWAEALDILERGLSDQWAEQWADRFWPYRVKWLAASGHAADAARLLDEFALHHSDSGSADGLVDAVWGAYWAMGETESGAQKLRATVDAHAGTRLATAINRLLDTLDAEPGRGRTTAPS